MTWAVESWSIHAARRARRSFTAAEVASLAGTAPAQQRTYLLSEKGANENDPRYANVCPWLAAWRAFALEWRRSAVSER
jgi:hypothetical protein